jgi:EAL domain-containing protein (putative c-di-GMP-specific phosphodiesterase class I)
VSFLAIAEHTRKLEAMTWFVIDAAQRQRADWTRRWGSLPVSVNIPPVFLEIPQVADHLKSSLQIWDSQPGDVVLEITEESVVRNPAQSFAVLAQMRGHGLRIAIDDFGTGYSSMAYFKEMPADEIKIDRSFVRNLPREIDNQHIVRAVIDLAHKFNYKVVAEGVETPEEFDVLRGMRCDIVQGFLFSRPQPHADFVQWLADYEVPEA